MSKNSIELKSIGKLLEMNFFIPSYQRGYRWSQRQVEDLLDDIHEFISKDKEGFYCIQPLVVRKYTGVDKEKNQPQSDKDDNRSWEVIDGQQRLTTIYILLSYLQDEANKYTIEYVTRPKSKDFLEKLPILDLKKTFDENFTNCIEKSDKDHNLDNIDFYNIIVAKQTIETWFLKNINNEIISFINSNLLEKKSDFFNILLKDDKKKFLDALLEKVKFIWYESKEEEPISVFTRLNLGKISLTNAELIKALFLNKSNFQGSENRVRLQQNEIAIEWDNIEYALQNDEFWLFLNNTGYDRPTRIDFIFDLMCNGDTDVLNVKELLKSKYEWKDEIDEKYRKELGDDKYRTFRYFYFWFKNQDDIDFTKCWVEVKKLFQILQEWFNDLELYHYIGFLIESKVEIKTIIDEWKKRNYTKATFISDFIIPEIKKKLPSPINFDQQYDVDVQLKKTACRPILLLHNIQTVINQNRILKEEEKYKLPVFYKFPFHLFKKEKWDVEHIDSNTENPLEDLKTQKEWLKYSYEYIPNDAELKVGENLKEKVREFIDFKFRSQKQNTGERDNNDSEHSVKEFVFIRDAVIKSIPSSGRKLADDEKNKLWNFTLLDDSTNRGYGNHIFPAKRRVIIGKDQGKKIEINDDLTINDSESTIAFIPPCTKNVFMKYFNPLPNNLREWDRDDANTYLENIKETLKIFIEKDGGQHND